MKLPTWNECATKDRADESLTAVEIFILNNEPPGRDNGWRNELQQMVDEIEEKAKGRKAIDEDKEIWR